MTIEENRTIALAGVFQAAEIAQSLARTGVCTDKAMAVMVASLLSLDAKDTSTVYGGVAGVVPGLKAIHNRMVTQAEISDFELGRYVFSLIQLAARLGQNANMAGHIHNRLTLLRENGVDENIVLDKGVPGTDVDGFEGQDVFSYLAATYSDTISQLVPQIIVHGEQGYLADEKVVDRVRTALLAGVRSAYLWAQIGGRKWHLVFQKRRYIERSARLLAEHGVSPIG